MLDVVGNATRFEVIITLLLGIVTFIGIFGRMVYKVTSGVYRQLDAIQDNTRALASLTQMIDHLDNKIDLVEQKVDGMDMAGTKGLHNHIEALRTDIQELKTDDE